MDVQLYLYVNGTWKEYNPKPASHTHGISNITNLQTTLNGKQDKLVAGYNITINPTTNVISASGGGGGGEVDLNEMAYFDYAGRVYGDKYSLLASAWEDMKEVDGAEIERSSSILIQYGRLQYPNGVVNGVIIPNGVTSIGDSAFRSWGPNNQPLVIPNSVTSIGAQAFQNWSSNNQPLVIPNSVTSIGELAFFGWSLVPYVEIQAITPPTLASSLAFAGQNDAPIYVPNESVAAYKAATNWVSLASRIFPISGNSTDLQSSLNNKLDKDFTSLPNQATPLLTDVMVLNRGTTAQKTTLGSLLALVGGTNSLVDALCWRGTCEAVTAEAATDALTWR